MALDDLVVPAVAHFVFLLVLTHALDHYITTGGQVQAGLVQRLVGIQAHRQCSCGLHVGLVLGKRCRDENMLVVRGTCRLT